MKSNAVSMIDNVQYDKVDDNGNLHISFGKERKDKKILDVNNIILCSGQISNTSIEDEADYDFSTKIYSIGGAYEALELDAKRAIDMGTRLALKIADKSVIPGKHNFEHFPTGLSLEHLSGAVEQHAPEPAQPAPLSHGLLVRLERAFAPGLPGVVPHVAEEPQFLRHVVVQGRLLGGLGHEVRLGWLAVGVNSHQLPVLRRDAALVS